jgi:hypothetical protein
MKRCLFLCNSMSPFSRKKVYGDETAETGRIVHVPSHRRCQTNLAGLESACSSQSPQQVPQAPRLHIQTHEIAIPQFSKWSASEAFRTEVNRCWHFPGGTGHAAIGHQCDLISLVLQDPEWGTSLCSSGMPLARGLWKRTTTIPAWRISSFKIAG